MTIFTHTHTHTHTHTQNIYIYIYIVLKDARISGKKSFKTQNEVLKNDFSKFIKTFPFF